MTRQKGFIPFCMVAFVLCFLLSGTVSFAQVGRFRSSPCKVLKDIDGLRRSLPECWYQKAAGLKVVTFKKNLRYGHELSLDPAVLSTQLDEIKSQGFSAIEIFAPAEGLTAYNGLDTKNHFDIDPTLGGMDDFRRAVRLAHSKRLAVIAFINVGYFSVEAPDWIQAAKDEKAGVQSDKTKWFLWADKPDAPLVSAQEDIDVTPAYREHSKDYWGWHYSELAGHYYWSRWKADGPGNAVTPLPETNWGDPGWRQEAERIVRFWMDTGIDGMLIDNAPGYPNQTWAQNRQHITSVIASYGNTLIDPEGARDTAWITEAGYNTLHDYGMNYGTAVDSGDPSKIDSDLRRYHDSVVEAGGVLYSAHWSNKFAGDPAKRHLQQALIVGVGGIVVYTKMQGSPDAEEAANLHLKQLHPALYPSAARRKLATNADDKYYAILKTARDGSERMVAVYNFQPTPQTVQLYLGVVDTPGIVDSRSGATISQPDQFHPLTVEMPAYGYRFFTVLPRS
jgi:Alpha amylase, catalytic domain